MLDFNKFSIFEMLSNSKGKSSLGLLMGFLYGVWALLLYLLGSLMVFKKITGYTDLFAQATILTAASTSLIGIRRFTKDKEINANNNTNTSNS